MHIGGDEVALKECVQCQNSMLTRSDLYLYHIIPVIQHFRKKGFEVFMWPHCMVFGKNPHKVEYIIMLCLLTTFVHETACTFFEYHVY